MLVKNMSFNSGEKYLLIIKNDIGKFEELKFSNPNVELSKILVYEFESLNSFCPDKIDKELLNHERVLGLNNLIKVGLSKFKNSISKSGTQYVLVRCTLDNNENLLERHNSIKFFNVELDSDTNYTVGRIADYLKMCNDDRHDKDKEVSQNKTIKELKSF